MIVVRKCCDGYSIFSSQPMPDSEHRPFSINVGPNPQDLDTPRETPLCKLHNCA